MVVYSVLGQKNNSWAISSWLWVLYFYNCCKLIIFFCVCWDSPIWLWSLQFILPSKLCQFEESGICVSLPRTIGGVSGQDGEEEELANTFLLPVCPSTTQTEGKSFLFRTQDELVLNKIKMSYLIADMNEAGSVLFRINPFFITLLIMWSFIHHRYYSEDPLTLQ